MTSLADPGVRVAADVQADVGEGPHWDEHAQCLWFVDLTAGDVYRYDGDGAVRAFSVEQEVGAVIPRRRGGLVLAVRDGIAVATDAGDAFDIRAPIERENTANRMNDTKCDAAGRLFAGTTGFDFTPGAGALYRIDADWSHDAAIEDVTTSNGTAWAPDGETMYFIDSGSQGVDAFDYDVGSGGLANRRRLVTIEQDAGIPDGMTVDREGNLWVACFGAGAVRCFSPSGEVVNEIGFPVSQVTSCAFGGNDYAELYVTTASYRLTPTQREREPHAGALFVCRPGVTGVPAAAFAG